MSTAAEKREGGAAGGRPSDAELESVLFPQLETSIGARPLHGRTRRSPFAYSTSSTLELLSVSFPDAPSLDLLFKDLSPRSLLPLARGVRPHFLQRPQLELLVYERFLAPRSLGTPTCYATAIDEEAGRYWLFLENIVGHPLCHVGEFAAWCDAARWLARIHSLRGIDLARAIQNIPVIHYDKFYYEQWRERARGCLNAEPPTDTAHHRQLERLVAAYEQAVPHLAAFDATLVHGEYYASNVLVPNRRDGSTVCPIDWGTAGSGPSGLDLAALTSGNWTDEQRLGMLSAYRLALEQAGGPTPAISELLREVQLCMLFHAVQWVFWAADWQPPLEQRHDWLNAGLALAERLGL